MTDSLNPPRTDVDTSNEPLDQLFRRYQSQLRAMIDLRMDRRVRGRVDPSDILQEAYLDAARRYDEFQRNPQQSPHLWLRFLAFQRLMITHRQHLQVKSRDAAREVSLDQYSSSVSSDGLYDYLVHSGTTPSANVARAEEIAKLKQVLEEMNEVDRDILVLRHFEQLSNPDAAQLLVITPEAASQRYYRALKKLAAFMLPRSSETDG